MRQIGSGADARWASAVLVVVAVVVAVVASRVVRNLKKMKFNLNLKLIVYSKRQLYTIDVIYLMSFSMVIVIKEVRLAS